MGLDRDLRMVSLDAVDSHAKKRKKLATPRVPTWSPTAVLTGPDGV